MNARARKADRADHDQKDSGRECEELCDAERFPNRGRFLRKIAPWS
jgi:hypothetical protein